MVGLAEPQPFYTGVAHGLALLPGRPPTWSYSSLKEIETCPRRYGLSRAEYPDLWDERGYPRMPIPAAIKGDVVHGSLEVIVKAMVRARCPSTRSAEAVAVLRTLGGMTAVAERVLASQLAQLEGNPRLSGDRRERLTRALTDWVPEARTQIQTYLNRMELRPSSTPSPADSTGSASYAEARFPARVGDHPEQRLIADDLRLKGRVDLLSVGAGGVEIIDFKTGAEDPGHHDQLRLYALLWVADDVVNPDGLPVISLVAAYPNHEVAVPVPSAAELATLREEVRTRVAAADDAASTDMPGAVVGEHCKLCNVRGLCDVYWATSVRATAEVDDGAWYDIEGTVVGEHGVKSWILQEARTGLDILVRTPSPSHRLPVGSAVRILGARRTVDPDEDDALIAALASASEVLEMTE